MKQKKIENKQHDKNIKSYRRRSTLIIHSSSITCSPIKQDDLSGHKKKLHKKVRLSVASLARMIKVHGPYILFTNHIRHYIQLLL